MEKIEEGLNDLGVSFYSPENGSLSINDSLLPLPSEISEVASRELGEFLNVLTQQKMYYRTVLGRLESQMEESKRKYVDSSSGLYQHYSNSKLSETAKERLINAEEEVKPFLYQYTDDKRRVSLVNYSIQNIEDAIFMVSRELTRRSSDFNNETRSHNVSKR